MPAPNSQNVQLSRDGSAWVALLGRNLQEGVGGFGDTPAEALGDLAARIEVERWEPTNGEPPLVTQARPSLGPTQRHSPDVLEKTADSNQ